MLKQDLKLGCLVEFRCKQRGLLIQLPTGEKTFVLLYTNGIINYFIPLMNFESDLKHIKDRQHDIMKVYKDHNLSKVLYERPTYKLSDNEKAILKSLPDKWKWICRDNFSNEPNLYLYENKPHRDEDDPEYWDCGGKCADLELFDHLFQWIKPDHDLPFNIKELLEE